MKLGIDIGGTKCAVVLGDEKGIYGKMRFDTTSCENTMAEIISAAHSFSGFDGIGVSCGGPLDRKKGLIMSPPNLSDWDNVPITDILTREFGVPAYLCNDANACALAEWRYGAGRGAENMIFLTFGTGMGAGLIINGRLYEGACGNAGEIGHIRMAKDGPTGYRKAGSFEGFCSGGGLTQAGRAAAELAIRSGISPMYCRSLSDLPSVSAKSIADAAFAGDTTAIGVYRSCGEKLGEGLAVLIDIINPDVIVIGSIFARARELLYPYAQEVIAREALSDSANCCRIVSAELGENIGDYAALAVAYDGEKQYGGKNG